MAWWFPRPSPILTAVIVIASVGMAAADDFTVMKSPAAAYFGPPYNWNGFYAGGHMGVAWGQSNWTTPNGPSGSINLFQPIDTFDEGGSFFADLQGATITCYLTVSSSAPKSMHLFRAFKPSLASRLAASRILPRRCSAL